eukprot:SAG11_NODE_18914_length_478_cov_1.184697_1_plen_60_part_01
MWFRMTYTHRSLDAQPLFLIGFYSLLMRRKALETRSGNRDVHGCVAARAIQVSKCVSAES